MKRGPILFLDLFEVSSLVGAFLLAYKTKKNTKKKEKKKGKEERKEKRKRKLRLMSYPSSD